MQHFRYVQVGRALVYALLALRLEYRSNFFIPKESALIRDEADALAKKALEAADDAEAPNIDFPQEPYRLAYEKERKAPVPGVLSSLWDPPAASLHPWPLWEPLMMMSALNRIAALAAAELEQAKQEERKLRRRIGRFLS